MPLEPPTPSQIGRIARERNMAMGDQELTECAELSALLLSQFDALHHSDGGREPNQGHLRKPGWAPTPSENSLGGWAWRCEIRQATKGPLAGEQVAVKDNIALADMPLLNGSEVFEGYVPDEDATVVSRILNAGGTINGKSIASSCCLDAFGDACYPSDALNPYDARCAAGGSSTGNAVLLATQQVDLAIGSDQGGSIRIPASWSGCCGLKPTHGLVPCTGSLGLYERIDHLGPMALTAAQCARLLNVIAGPDGNDPRQRYLAERWNGNVIDSLTEVSPSSLRVGVLREGFGLPGISEPQVDAAVRSVAKSLSNAGSRVAEVSAPKHGTGPAAVLAMALEGVNDDFLHRDDAGVRWNTGRGSSSFQDFYGRARKEKLCSYPASVKLIAVLGDYLSANYHHVWQAAGHHTGVLLAQQYDELLDEVDFLLLPTTPMRATPKTKRNTITESLHTIIGNTQNTIPFNATGHPALSVPCALVDGLPVGAMLVGRRFDDTALLATGRLIETLRGPFPSPPFRTAADRLDPAT